MKRPNILLFLTDDHGAWALGSAGNREVQTPNLDALAREGVRFQNAFAPCPVCSPARACLMTGRTPSQVGIHDWIQESHAEYGDRPWLAAEITLPQRLSEGGYHCGLSGKWHLERSHQTPRGFDWCFGLPRWQGTHNGAYTYHLNGEPLALTGNKTAFITDYALEFLRQSPPEKPFFLNVGFIATHSPYEAQAHDPALTALYQDAAFDDIPPYVPHPWAKNEGFPADSAEVSRQCRTRYQGYYAAVTEIDRAVGRLMDALRQQGRLDDTIVIYTGDHGCALGHHGFWGKGNSTRPLNFYDTSLRVPLIWRGPQRIAAHTVSHCVDHYDTFQTLCEIAQVTPDTRRDYPGRSYRALLHGESLEWNEARYGEYGDSRMIRTPQWKLVVRYPDGPHDLFDLQNDPHETRNLAGDAAHGARLKTLRRDLEQWYAAHQDPLKSGLRVHDLPQHNASAEAWRDGVREARGLQPKHA